MLAIELVKIILGLFAFFAVAIGIMMSFDAELFDNKGNTVLIIAGIALIILFHI